MAGNNATKIPVIKGKVFKIRPKDNDSMFPFNSVLAETKPPVIPVGFHPQLKPPLQILYEQSYKGHNQQNPSSFKAILQKKENQRNNDDNDAETHLSSPKITNSFIDAIKPEDLRIHLGFFQTHMPGYG